MSDAPCLWNFPHGDRGRLACGHTSHSDIALFVDVVARPLTLIQMLGEGRLVGESKAEAEAIVSAVRRLVA